MTARPLGSSMRSMKIKTEHNGSKKGSGAYYGRKRQAKKLSNKARRAIDRKESRT